jgi:hypothetical protein
MDLTRLSESDLKALADGRVDAMSTEGLQYIASQQPQQTPQQAPQQAGALSRVMQTARESPMQLMEPFSRGVAEGMFVEPALGISQLVSRGLGMGETELDRYIQRREQTIEQTPGMESGRLGGMLLSPAAAPLSRIPGLVSSIPLIGGSRTVQSAATGGSAALLTPVTTEGDFAEQKATQAGVGAIAGPIMDVAISPLARMGAPERPEALALQRSGVDVSRLTPGQQLGGVAKRAEETLKSVPILGEAVRQAEMRGFEEFNRGLINNVVKQASPNVSVPKSMTTSGAIDFAGKELSRAYTRELSKINIVPDVNMFLRVSSVVPNFSQQLTKENADLLEKLVNNRVVKQIQTKPGQSLSGQTIKRIDSELGELEAKYRKSADAQQRTIGEALGNVKETIRDYIGQQDPSGKINNLNAIYADFLRLENAASRSQRPGNVFSPEQLQQAVRGMDSSRRGRAFARGQARMQQTAEAGREMLGTRVPDSGTPERLSVPITAAGIASMLGGTGAVPVENLLVPGLLGAGALGAYTRPGQATIRGISQIAPGLRSTLPLIAPQFAQE